MNASLPAPPKLGPVDLSESVAGEEDPGASLDLPPPPPGSLPEGATGKCIPCGGSGKLAAGPCPDCRGTGKSASRL